MNIGFFTTPAPIRIPTGIITQAIHLAPGKIIGLLGENGIGKTSFIRSLKYELGDKRVKNGSWNYAFLDQVPLDSYRMGSVENLVHQLLGCRALSWKLEAANLWHKLIDDLKWNDLIKKDLSVLSGGQKQLLKWILVELQDAHIYFLDEPFQQLDQKKIDLLRGKIKRLASMNHCVLMIDHHKDRLFELCDFIIEMQLIDDDRLIFASIKGEEELFL